jgi:hypothetical protein
MGRHHTADADTTAAAQVALRSTPFPSIPAPRVSPESAQAVPAVPAPRGWRARRAAKAEAAAAQAHAVQVAHAQRRARQVALASLLDD